MLDLFFFAVCLLMPMITTRYSFRFLQRQVCQDPANNNRTVTPKNRNCNRNRNEKISNRNSYTGHCCSNIVFNRKNKTFNVSNKFFISSKSRPSQHMPRSSTGRMIRILILRRSGTSRFKRGKTEICMPRWWTAFNGVRKSFQTRYKYR
jgi:hypothetical protein